ncbi:MAG: hypothetical protein JO161_03145, partial [Planctomycetaceae bacterium]|nr:hypothetical protein [Planctomycetaceae bacterium]
NGSSWSIVDAPTPSGGGQLNAVKEIAADNVWAVGGLGNNGALGNLIEHFDGTSWSVVNVPNASRAFLSGVSGTSRSDIWAVGRIGRHPSTEILHFDGTSWTTVPSVSPQFDSVLTAVTALALNNVWAVGTSGGGSGNTLIEHFDGTSWSVVPSPNPTSSPLGQNVLSGIAAVSASDIWAVGHFTDPTSGFERTLTEHFDGTSWSVIASPNGSTGHNDLNGVTALGDGTGTVVAVGYANDSQSSSNTNGLILRN